ncbi:hypothetical protein GCM10010199_44960 [Dactylosporangium roseum]
MAPARARVAADGGPAAVTRIRAISHWATTAMLGVAGTALAQLLIAFVPLADIWAAHRPGAGAAALAATVRIVAWILLAATALVAAIAFAGWLTRARSNLAAFGVEPRKVTTGSVGRSPELRRRMTVLSWLFRVSLLAACLVTGLGLVAGLDNVDEIGDVRDQAAAGHPVDGALVADLFGRQLMLRLPGAALFVVAAVFALLLIARTTSAQYGRVARLRGVTLLPAAITALRPANDDWTVVLPAHATPTTVGGTIRE